MGGGRVEYDLSDFAWRSVDSLNGVKVLGFPVIGSPVIELAGFDFPNANFTIIASRSYYRVVEGTPGGVEDGSSVVTGKGNEIGELDGKVVRGCPYPQQVIRAA